MVDVVDDVVDDDVGVTGAGVAGDAEGDDVTGATVGAGVTGAAEGDGVTGADEGEEVMGAELIILEQREVTLTSFKTAMENINEKQVSIVCKENTINSDHKLIPFDQLPFVSSSATQKNAPPLHLNSPPL